MSKSMIQLRHTDRKARERVDIEFPIRVRVISRTPKAVLAEPLRKHHHGCYVPRLWIPRTTVPETVPDQEDIVTVTVPMWLWEKNARPEPPQET